VVKDQKLLLTWFHKLDWRRKTTGTSQKELHKKNFTKTYEKIPSPHNIARPWQINNW
jgi:hypothetical protein